MREEGITHTIIPASPGWQLSIFVGGDIGDVPIVAWEIKRDASQAFVLRSVIPITIDDTATDTESFTHKWMIHDPAGKYHDPLSGAQFSSAQEALDYLAKQRHQQPKVATGSKPGAG